MKEILVELGKEVKNPDKSVFLKIKNGVNVLCEGAPRTGKGALSKHSSVIISKHKKVCIFDFRGEWTKHVTEYNLDNPDSAKMNDVYVARSFAFPITEFNKTGDWIGFEMEDYSAKCMVDIIQNKNHNGDLKILEQMIGDIPEDKSDILDFWSKYGIKMRVMHSLTKEALQRRFEVIKKYFWTGTNDRRKLVDFESVWKKHKNLIVDLSSEDFGFNDMGVARAYAGLILRKMLPDFKYSQGLYVFEEASQLLGIPKLNEARQPVGLSELHSLVVRMLTLEPKYGINVWCIVQNRSQLFPPISDKFTVLIVGALNLLDEALNDVEKMCNDMVVFDRGSRRREWVLYDVLEKHYTHFVAVLPCCGFETNR